jgi:uncharacterized protein with HEPN domain
MPRRELSLLLQDMLDHGNRAVTHLGNLSRDDFRQDQLRRDAVERCLIILGEALAQGRHQDPSIMPRITSAQRIIDFRNIMVHGYAMIDTEVVWDIVRVHPPILLGEVRMLWDEHRGGASL